MPSLTTHSVDALDDEYKAYYYELPAQYDANKRYHRRTSIATSIASSAIHASDNNSRTSSVCSTTQSVTSSVSTIPLSTTSVKQLNKTRAFPKKTLMESKLLHPLLLSNLEQSPAVISVSGDSKSSSSNSNSAYSKSNYSFSSNSSNKMSTVGSSSTIPLLSLEKPSTISNESHPGSKVDQSVITTPLLHDVDHIRVAIRMRPLAPPQSNSLRRSHRVRDEGYAWQLEDGKTVTQKHATFRTQNRTSFTFDSVFDDHSTTYDVYQELCDPIVNEVLNGKNGTIFAYGQTGSGKTYTMQGDNHNPGVIPLAAQQLFDHLEENQDKRSFIASVQYFEIYNEQIRDLLSGESPASRTGTSRNSVESLSTNASPLSIYETADGSINVNGQEEIVRTVDDVLFLLKRGHYKRKSASTDANSQSSRSHAIFRISVSTCCLTTGTTQSSQLNLVDLAGSENSHRSGTSGLRKREGGKINQSLLSLSRVIHALSLPPKKQPKYIGYRDSKLTRILQPSLSGNAYTAVICCISNAHSHIEETRSTLKFASSAKRITVQPAINESIEDPYATIARLKQELVQAHCTIRELQALTVPKNVMNAAAITTAHNNNVPEVVVHTIPMEPEDKEEFDEPSTANLVTQFSDSESDDTASEAVAVTGTFEFEDLSFAGREYSETSHDSITASSSDQHQHPPVQEILVLEENSVKKDIDSTARLEDAEQRVQFLENKLEATDELVETLFRDLKNAQNKTSNLNAARDQLIEQLTNLQLEMDEKADDNEVLTQQHLLLKYGIYAGLALYLIGYRDTFMAVVVFMWLSLELVT